MSTAANAATPPRVAIRDGLLSMPLTDLGAIQLMGSRCASCSETTLGSNRVCPNCGGSDIKALPLGRRGVLWTYTVVHHRPPGDYKGPEPFVPFAMGLVELPEGLRVLAPIAGDPARVKIGMSLDFQAFVRPGSAAPEVVSFHFAPLGQG